MKNLLVISPDKGMAEALRSCLDRNNYRVLEAASIGEDEMRQAAPIVDACVLDADLATVDAIRQVGKARRLLPQAPLLLYSAGEDWKWEEEAYVLGVNNVLRKPVRARQLLSILDRLLAQEAAPEAPKATASLPKEASASRIDLLLQLSSLLAAGLQVRPLLNEAMLLLRAELGINRAAIFLRQGRHLQPTCSIGLLPGVLRTLDLTTDDGIGEYVSHHGKALRLESAGRQARREFQTLGTKVAIPMFDQESMVGVAFLDNRITGEPIGDGELAALFFLFERLSAPIKAICEHEQEVADHGLLAGIVHGIQSGCVVIKRDLSILFLNEPARHHFGLPGGAVQFRDLPQDIGSRVFQAFQGAGTPKPFDFISHAKPEVHCRASITSNGAQADALTLWIEDCSQADLRSREEAEAASLKAVRGLAGRLAHEIGNAVVPIFAQHQLADGSDPELRQAVDEGINRVGQLVGQMRALAQDRNGHTLNVPVAQLIEEAFAAQKPS